MSWSALSTFRTCPLKYKFQYVDGLPEEFVSSALVFGTGIHSEVEQYYQALLSGEEQPDIERLMFVNHSAWLPHEPDVIQFGVKETRETLDDLAARMLTAFLSSPTASVQWRVLGVEEEIRSMLVEGMPDLYGRVDLLTEDADTLTITDIKTSRGKWSQERVGDSGEQLLLYSHLASEIAPGKKIATRFLVLTKTKEPVVEEHTREVEPAAVKRALASVERVWRAVESGVSIRRHLPSRAHHAAIELHVGRRLADGLEEGAAQGNRRRLLLPPDLRPATDTPCIQKNNETNDGSTGAGSAPHLKRRRIGANHVSQKRGALQQTCRGIHPSPSDHTAWYHPCSACCSTFGDSAHCRESPACPGLLARVTYGAAPHLLDSMSCTPVDKATPLL